MTLVLWKTVLLYSLTLVSFGSPTTLIASLTQSETNGNSQLGTLKAPTLPKFLTNNPLPEGYPWGSKTASNSNPYEQSPTTGVIRTYNFVIERDFKAPDGVNRSVIMINGQIPGPTIEANWGDTIQVTVTNNITGPEEGTSLHWHGLLQTETPWFDGVPSVQQCPIAPGSTFTYSFKAGLYGTSWYHSHYSAQYADGLSGPIVIYGPNNTQYDIVDLGPVFLSDWYHEPSFSIVESQEVNTTAAPKPPSSDNNLINGKGNFNCSLAPTGTNCVPNAGLSKFNFQSGKTHRLRLINAGAEGIQRFTIDGYEMTVIANDFVPIQPYTTDMVTLGVGQRTDILVEATGEPTDAVWMRSNISEKCSSPNQPYALAAIYYESANKTQEPTTTATTYDDSHCGNDPLDQTVPFYKYSPLGDPATTKEVDITFQQNSTGYWQWTTNNQSFRADYNDPLLLLANQGNTSYPPDSNIYDFGSNTSIRIVLYNEIAASHPMHLHGHNFWVVAEGTGEWNGTVNSINPQRRDTQLLQAKNGTEPGYLVLEFNADNPGVWPFHCHIAWHVSSGLYMNIMERPADITEVEIPSIMQQTCTDWASFSANNVVDEIDSGL